MEIMIKKNILSILLLFTALCTFNSCEVEHDEFYDFEQRLYASIWSEEYLSAYGEDVYHEIYFDPDGTGSEYFEYYTGGIKTEVKETFFRWEWSRDFPYSIEIYYPNTHKPSYFDDIQIVRNKLYVVWDDVDIVLTGV